MTETRLDVTGGSITLELGDITTFEVDAIVNAANSGLMGGGGVDGAIHRAAGPALDEECRAIVDRQGPLPPGHAVITSGGNLQAKHVIHTVGPIWGGDGGSESRTLASAYRAAIRLVGEHGLRTVAFPSISTGAYGYPIALAAPVAVAAVRDALADVAGPIAVTFVLHDPATFQVYAEALGRLAARG